MVTFKVYFLNFLLNTASLLMAVSNYSCLIKHPSKQNRSLAYCETNSKLKEIDFNNII